MNVDSPGILRPEFVGYIDRGRPKQVLAPFLRRAQDDVDVHRVDARVVYRLACCLDGHFIRMDLRVSDILPFDTEFFAHHPFG